MAGLRTMILLVMAVMRMQGWWNWGAWRPVSPTFREIHYIVPPNFQMKINECPFISSGLPPPLT